MSVLNRLIDLIRDDIYELKDLCNNHSSIVKKHAESLDKNFEETLNILLAPKKEMEPIKYREVILLGWYLHLRPCPSGTSGLNNTKDYGAFYYEYVGHSEWRTDMGHGCNIEDTEYFNDNDLFIGPIKGLERVG